MSSARRVVIDSARVAAVESLIQGARSASTFSLIPPPSSLYCLGIAAMEKLRAIFLMEINAPFRREGNDRGVLLMFFHFQPVSFPLEAPPCRSPCPLATDVVSRWVEKKGKAELFCGSAFCSAPPLPHFHVDFSLFFSIFALNPAAKKKRRKKGVKEKKKINRETQSDPVVSMRLPLKHFFFFCEEKASEWRRNETKLFPVTFDPASSKSPWS